MYFRHVMFLMPITAIVLDNNSDKRSTCDWNTLCVCGFIYND